MRPLISVAVSKSEWKGFGVLQLHYTTLHLAVFNTPASHTRELFTNYVRFIASGAISVITFHCLPSSESWVGEGVWVRVWISVQCACVLAAFQLCVKM